MRALSIIAMLTLFCSLTHGYGQRLKYYMARVTLVNDSRVKGVLYTADEDGILLMDKNLLDTIRTIENKDIELIKVRKKGRVGNSALIGAAGGIVVGGLIGFASGDDSEDCWLLCYSAEEKALIGAAVLVVPSAGIGALIGTESKKFQINGNVNQYKLHLPELNKYTLK